MFALFCVPWAANAQESIPYTEGFESMSSADDLTAAGWISYQTHSGSLLAIETNASNVHSGSQALNIDSWNAGSTSDFVVVGLPLVDAAINTLQITFSYKVSTGNVYVGYLTDANDASTFVSLESYIASSSYTTVTKELNEAPATAARIAIKYLNWYRCYVDDIEVKALPTCVKPTLGNAQFISEEGASLQWTENGSATSWVLEYSTDQNFTDATSVTRNGISSYAITGLTAGTTYYVRVKSSCGDGDESDWSNVVTFTTLCESINAEGYSENFDEYEVASNYTAPSARVLPDCWSAINTTSYSNYSVFPTIYYYSSTNYANSGPNSLKLYSYYSSYSDYDPQPQYAILPPMNSLTGMQVTLQARGYNTSSTFKIGTMSDPSDASTFTMITEQTGLTTSYQEFEYVIPANCHDNFLAIMIDAASSSRTYNGAYIDDIVITEAPACTKPFGLAVVSASTTSATLSWTASGNETAWQICLDGDETNLIDANSNPFTIEGLTAATSYTAKVRANCGDEDYSDWSNTVTIETLCDVITITESWSENFNSLTAGIPNCWDNSEGTTTNASYMWSYYTTGHDGAGLRFNSYSNSNNNTNFLKTPTFNFATGKVMQLRFWYKNPTGGDFSVFISTDGGSTYTTALATGLTGVSSWTQQEINLTNYVDAENVVIVFKGTSNYGSGDAYIYLDDVAIVEAPSCQKPTELAVTANGLTATLTWESEVGEYEVAYSTDNTANPDENIADTATDETYTMNGLALGDHYFWVRANCGSDGYSEWVGPVSVHIGYCVPNPTSHDGSGITGVSFGMGDYVVENGGEGTSIPASTPYYGDYSNMIGAVQAGVESTIAITTSTGSYPYTFVIWVDFDNSLSFEDSEVVYVGKASSGAGTFEATITVPATQATGDYRMRIYDGKRVDWEVFRTEPFFPSYATIESAEAAYRNVLSDAGCNLPVMLNHDRRMVQETLNGTTSTTGYYTNKKGLIDREMDAEGFEGLDINPSERGEGWDTDCDGLPDWFEALKGTDASAANNNSDPDGDGYTDLEDYLNWMAAPHFTMENNLEIELLPYFAGYTHPDFSVDSISDGLTSQLTEGRLTVSATSSVPGLSTIHIKAEQGGVSLTRTFNIARLRGQDGIENTAVSTTASDRFYDLNGRSSLQPQKGVNIHKGIKIIYK